MPDNIRRLREIVGHDELLQIPSVSIALRNSSGSVLLARHAMHGLWLLPGGSIEPGEAPADAAVREMQEETGLTVTLTRLVGVFGGAEYVVTYPNGDRTSYVTCVFDAACADAGIVLDANELLEVRWFSLEQTRELAMPPWMPEVLDALFAPSDSPGFRPPGPVRSSP